MKPGIPHGTRRGYDLELAAGMPPCEACTAAVRDRERRRQRRMNPKCAKGLGWPLAGSYMPLSLSVVWLSGEPDKTDSALSGPQIAADRLDPHMHPMAFGP